MLTRITRLVLAVLVVACMVVLACDSGSGSGGGGGGDSPDQSSSTSSTSNTPSDANADRTPDYINFGGAIAQPGQSVTSWIATVTGVDVPVDFVVNAIAKTYSSPQYRINGGAWKNVVIGSPVQVKEGQTIQLKVTAPPIFFFDTILWGISVGTAKTNWQVAS